MSDLLNLLLVGLDLLLQLVGEVGHAVLVLLVLVLGKLQLLDLTVRPLEGLHRLHGLGLSRSKFSLKFSDSQLQLAESILALLHGTTLSIRQSALHLSELVLQSLLGSRQTSAVVLFCSEFISKTSSINHGLLGLVLAILGSNQHGVDLCLDCVDGSLQVPLDGGVAGVDGLHLRDGQPGVGDLLSQLTVGSLRRVKKSTRLLHFSIEGSSLSLRDSNLFADLLSGSCLVLETLDGLPM